MPMAVRSAATPFQHIDISLATAQSNVQCGVYPRDRTVRGSGRFAAQFDHPIRKVAFQEIVEVSRISKERRCLSFTWYLRYLTWSLGGFPTGPRPYASHP
jgi:hypothetical protein